MKLKSYLIGFILSIALTLAAYFLVEININAGHEIISRAVLIPSILALAMAQLAVQLLFFLHLGGKGIGERWKLGIFIATFGLVLIVVVGSLWIMNHLNYSMMASPAQMEQYMQDQQGGF